MLIFIRLLHTIVWVFFVAVILMLPALACMGEFVLSAIVVGLVAFEGVILLANRGRCPLTNLAAHYTDSRKANFDIYLPEWLAKNNKLIFTPMALIGASVALALWIMK